MKEAHTQVHFYPDNSASCVVNVASSGNEGIADTLLLWACFANRQLNNMGKDAPSLAGVLGSVKGGLVALAEHDGEGPRLLDACPGQARKRFEGHLVPAGEGLTFKLAMKGFGVFGKGLRFYCPISVILLLRHMAKRGQGDPRFIACLENLAETTGTAFMRGDVNMRNGDKRAYRHVLAALSEPHPSPAAQQPEASQIHAARATVKRPDDPGYEKDLDSLTSMLAQGFAEVRELFYSGCVEAISRMRLPSPNKVQPTLTRDGHFVVGSYQMWLTFNVLDWKREKYLPPSAAQQFVPQMYGKVLGPHLPEGTTPETVAKGVLRLDTLRREGEHEPEEEFWHRMQEIIFDGTCDIGGCRRSSAALGLRIGAGELAGISEAVHHMVMFLIHATQLVLANAFGDDKFAAELSKTSEELGYGQKLEEVSHESFASSVGTGSGVGKKCPECGKNVTFFAPASSFYAQCPNCHASVYVGP
jgi:hypothetical protein